MKIIIKGACAEGKTTISLLIQEALMRAGFGVHNADFDVQAGGDYLQEFQAQRVEALVKNDTLIDIETVQIRRELDDPVDPR